MAVVNVAQMNALDMLGEIELVQRRIRTHFALELWLRPHLLEFAVDERPILHVVLERRLGLLLAQHNKRIYIKLGMKRADMRAHVRQSIGPRATMRTQVWLPAVAHQVAVVAGRARCFVATVRTAPYLRAVSDLIVLKFNVRLELHVRLIAAHGHDAGQRGRQQTRVRNWRGSLICVGRALQVSYGGGYNRVGRIITIIIIITIGQTKTVAAVECAQQIILFVFLSLKLIRKVVRRLIVEEIVFVAVVDGVVKAHV